MKTTANKFKLLIEQLLILIFIDCQLLISEGFIYKEQWLTSFVFAVVFLHLGFFISIYYILKSTVISVELNKLLTDFSCFVLCGFLSLICFHNCQVNSGQLAINFSVAIVLLFFTVIFGFDGLKYYNLVQKQIRLNH